MTLSVWVRVFGFACTLVASGTAVADVAKPAELPKVPAKERALARARIIEERLDAGREALYQGSFIKAERLFEAVLDFDPGNRAALEGGAAAAFENARYFKALIWTERALVTAPTISNYILLGHAFVKLGQFESAVGAYTKALAIRPDDRDTHERMRLAQLEGEAEKRARLVMTIYSHPDPQ